MALRSSPTVFADTSIPGSTSTRIWAGNPPRYRGKVSCVYFRGDAGFANPEVHEFLEVERIKYAIRLLANRILQDRIG